MDGKFDYGHVKMTMINGYSFFVVVVVGIFSFL